MTNYENAQQTMALLNRLEAPLVGVVLAGATSTPDQYYYYYKRGTAREIARLNSRAATERAGTEGNRGANGKGSSGDLFDPKPVAWTDDR